MTDNNMTEIGNIQAAVRQFGFTAVVAIYDLVIVRNRKIQLIASNELVIVRNRKNQLCAKVTADGVEQIYSGNKNLCGELVRNAIVAAIK